MVRERWYNYTIGFDVVSTEDDADGSTGALTMTNVVRTPTAQVSATLGDLAGVTPSTGTVRYYAMDHLGSTRSAWNASKVAVGTYEFTPYGGEYNHTGAALESLAGAYTGKPWDDSAKLFHFPYRRYSPDMRRWTSRDPLEMVDGPTVYAYARSNPLSHTDPMGLLVYDSALCCACLNNCLNTAARAQERLDVDDYLEWVKNAKPCLECAPICGAAARSAFNLLLKKAMKGAR